MGSPAIFGGNNISTLLQPALGMNGGATLNSNGAYNYIPTTSLNRGLTTGFSLGTATLTSNLPSGVPTFGSGASGNLSLSASSTSPISSVFSLLYASSAATTAGDFVATDALTLRREDQAKVLQFKFAYEASVNPTNGNFSGTASNSFGVAIYDVTNSAWIIPAGVFNLVQNSGVGICSGTFQTPVNMSSYRLVIYNANASSGAITMKLDDFFCGPQIIPQGAAIEDWNTIRVFSTGGLGTLAASYIESRQVGDTLEVRGWFTSGTTAASTAYIGLPLSINTAKMTASANKQKVGDATPLKATGGDVYDEMNLFYDGSTATQIFITDSQGGTAQQYTKRNGSDILASGNTLTFNFSVPIAGWSSNTVMSNDTDTRVITAQASGTPGSTPAASILVLGTVAFDNSGSYNSGTGRFTAPVSGFYQVDFFASIAGVAIQFYVYVNGVLRRVICQSGANASYGEAGSATVQVNAGDILDIRPDGTTGTINAMVVTYTRVTGPATIAASESVNARYTSAAGQNIPTSTATIVDFGTKDYDSHNAVTTGGSWKFTAPISGKYQVKLLSCYASSSFTSGTLIEGYIYKNGVVYSALDQLSIAASSTQRPRCTGSDDIQLAAGDFIDVRLQQNDGGGRSLQADAKNVHIAISRIGN